MRVDPETDLGMGLVLRRFQIDDASSIAKHANNMAVAKNLTLRFPFPYRLEDARFFVDHMASAPETDIFAITLRGEVVGATGLDLLDDVECRTIDLGYWIGEPFFGRGIATRVVGSMTARAFREYPDMIRLQARVHSGNDGSARVLEKNGFDLEAVHKRAITRFGETRDSLYYVRFREMAGDGVPSVPPGR